MKTTSEALQMLPLGRAVAADIKTIKEPGLVLPVRDRDVPLLMTEVSGEMHAVVLEGSQAFVHFAVTSQSPHQGLFIPGVEVIVDFNSASSDSRYTERLGALVLRRNELSLVASRAGNSFYGAGPLPLWTKVHGGSESGSLAFTQWGLAVPHEGKLTTLWQHGLDERE